MITRIKSDNFNGETVNITFTPDTGGTININGVVIPYDYVSNYPYGDYSIYVISADKTCPLNVPNLITPTPTPTSTVTPTPTITPTPTPTPSPFVASVSIAPTGTTKYNFISLSGSSNIGSPTYIWSLTDFYDYSGNTITSYTGQTTPIGEFRNTGSTLVELTVVGDNPLYPGNPVSATTSSFNVIVPTTYRMFFGESNSTNLYYTDDLINFSSTTTNYASLVATVVYSPKLDIYVKGSFTNPPEYSYDGISWSGATGTFGNRFKNIMWVPELQIFAAVTDRSNYFYYSSDGISWNRHGTFTFGDINQANMIWDDINDLFILTDDSGDIWTSPSGQTWTLQESQSYDRNAGITTYSGLTTVVYSDYSAAIYSYDGINWSAATFNTPQTGRPTFSAIVDAQGNRVFAGSTEVGGGGFAISNDGINISGITAPTGSSVNFTSSIYNEAEDKFILAMNGQSDIYVSTDKGQTYQLVSIPATAGSRTMGIRYNI